MPEAVSIGRFKQLLRLLRLSVHIAFGLWLCAVVLPRRSASSRESTIRKWSQKLLQIFGVRVELFRHDSVLQPGVVAANHLSWLDIFVIDAVQPCRFVAKAEIRSWPLLGYLCSSTRTIFISRSNARDVRKIFQQMAEGIEDGDTIAFFPEGTTASQGALLPFHANLFEAAINAGVPIQPIALRYLDCDGNLHGATEYTGDITFGQSMMRLLRTHTVRAQITVLPQIASDIGNRRVLASATRSSIAEGLGHPPEFDGT